MTVTPQKRWSENRHHGFVVGSEGATTGRVFLQSIQYHYETSLKDKKKKPTKKLERIQNSSKNPYPAINVVFLKTISQIREVLRIDVITAFPFDERVQAPMGQMAVEKILKLALEQLEEDLEEMRVLFSLLKKPMDKNSDLVIQSNLFGMVK